MSSVSATCANCQKPAYTACSGCNDTPDYGQEEAKKTSYCSSECQKANWAAHSKLCKKLQNRKALFRATDILQEIFYLYREKTFDKRITKVEEKDGIIFVHELNPFDGKDTINELDLLQQFPSDLAEDHRKAILANMACTDTLLWMQ